MSQLDAEIKGGTMAAVALIMGKKLYVANVGRYETKLGACNEYFFNLSVVLLNILCGHDQYKGVGGKLSRVGYPLTVYFAGFNIHYMY